ncbi:unnamed protein product [Timema podura]|uniref:Uncharacterized protein n=1 Tax=Timema podura TaxID=61482 RepID=A0ABN7NYG7_TIMPD|nr:unnamed protein product [Timema podura]
MFYIKKRDKTLEETNQENESEYEDEDDDDDDDDDDVNEFKTIANFFIGFIWTYGIEGDESSNGCFVVNAGWDHLPDLFNGILARVCHVELRLLEEEGCSLCQANSSVREHDETPFDENFSRCTLPTTLLCHLHVKSPSEWSALSTSFLQITQLCSQASFRPHSQKSPDSSSGRVASPTSHFLGNYFRLLKNIRFYLSAFCDA